jgi:hypothetical protein
MAFAREDLVGLWFTNGLYIYLLEKSYMKEI